MRLLFLALAALSFVLMVWQWIAARLFPLHQRVSEPLSTNGPESDTPSPAVTVFKPLKGIEPRTKECLRSWFQQEYPAPVQLLFGVASAADPVCDVVRDLLVEFPHRDSKLVICDGQLGPNAKLSTLAQLQPHARNDVWVMSDADVRVPNDFLADSVPALNDPHCGLVTCFYRLANPTTPAMHWEAVAINADFWSQVLQAQWIKRIDFALGAVMIVRKREIERIGGFQVLVDYLADDYHLGRKISVLGLDIQIGPVVVECWSGPMGWASAWKHQLRWARTIRSCKPLPYFFSILSNTTLWSFAVISTATGTGALSFGLFCLVARGFTAVDQIRRLGGRLPSIQTVAMIWPKDILQAAIWAVSFIGSEVEWRGQRYRVGSDGKLTPVVSAD